MVPLSSEMGVNYISMLTITYLSFKPKSIFHFSGPLIYVRTVRPIKKFTFRSYGTVSLFNYVRARYAGQLTYL